MSNKTVSVGIQIYNQLGGNKFRAMTGASNLLSSSDVLSFRIPRAKNGINYVRIALNAGSDTYNMEFWKSTLKAATIFKAVQMIYADQLQEIFTEVTGLDTHL